MSRYNDIFEVSPPVIKQRGQFSISVKNNKKLDAEKIKKLEFQVITLIIIFNWILESDWLRNL